GAARARVGAGKATLDGADPRHDQAAQARRESGRRRGATQRRRRATDRGRGRTDPDSGRALSGRSGETNRAVADLALRRHMEIRRSGSQPSEKGPAEWFTGTVRIDPLFRSPDPARAAGAAVTFEPGARTAWHTHPLGQTLVVVAGAGRVRRWNGPI